MDRGIVFNIQRFSLHDGPGIRTTVFLKGCPLHCLWCHNPEGLSPYPEILLSPQRCIACGECVEACPQELPVPGKPLCAHDLDRCQVCGACADACPAEARQVAGRTMTVDEVMAEIVRDRVFFDESGGGATFSGGEPLTQSGFLRRLLQACREEGIHSVVDTSGVAPWEALASIADLVDLFLYDLKILDDRLHRQLTGASNLTILENLQRLGERGRRIWIRLPVIPGMNDGLENLEATVRLAAGIPGVERICLLPFHPLGEDKRRRMGSIQALQGVERPSDERMQQLLRRVESLGLQASLGG